MREFPMQEEYYFCGLSAAELERLAILSEECGEIVQIVGKILRHGYESTNPNETQDLFTNRELLEKEIGDFQCILEMMEGNKDVSADKIILNKNKKWEKIKKYLHHN